MARKHGVCYADEIPVGGRRIVDIAGRSIGIFNVANEYFAVRNACPHKGAPLCKGALDAFVTGEAPGEVAFQREGEILRCPWHGWEFDLKTGESVFNPHKVAVRSYPVSVEGQAEEEDPAIETFPVSVERTEASPRPMLYVHL